VEAGAPAGAFVIQQGDVQLRVHREVPVSVDHGTIRQCDDAFFTECVQRSMFSPQPAPGQVAGGSQPGQLQEAEVVQTCSHGQALLVSHVQLGLGGNGAPALLYLPQGLACTAAIAAAAQQLYSSLQPMFTNVFATQRAGSHQLPALLFFVCYSPHSSTIAFNKGGSLWFNAAARPDLSASRSPVYVAARFWFLVACHELAHNKVGPHNSAFSNACAEIVLEFSGRFRAFAMQHCGMAGIL
jgi:hypothetical protein